MATARVALSMFLDRLTARSALTSEEQEIILELPGREVNVGARRDFVSEGNESRQSCLIVSGLAARFSQVRSGARQVTGFSIPGDFADLHSAVRPSGLGGMMAISDTTIYRIPHEAIESAAIAYPAIAKAFWRDCVLDAAILVEWVTGLGKLTAVTRLARIFCEMAVRHGRLEGPSLSYPFRITQEQLGEAAGLTGVHVNRSLKTLRDKGAVVLTGGQATIKDWRLLVTIAEFNSDYLLADTISLRDRPLLRAA